MGPKTPRSTVLSYGEEAIVVAFRKHTLLPLDDCLYALQATIPHLTRSALHRCLQRHGISRLPEIEGEKPSKKKFKTYPIGFVHIDIAEARTEQGKVFLFIAIDRTSKLAFARLVEKANTATAVAFLNELVEAIPYKIDVVLTDNGIQSPICRRTAKVQRQCYAATVRSRLPAAWHRASADQPTTLDQWSSREMNRTLKEATVQRYHYESHDQLRRHLADFLAAYNFAKRLKTLAGLTPHEYVCKIWTENPKRFKIDRTHLTWGLYN